MSDNTDTSMEGLGGNGGFRGGGIVWTSTQTGTETINDILNYSSKSVQRSRPANAARSQVGLSSINSFLLKGSSSSVPYLYAAPPHSFPSFDSASVATSLRASSGSDPTSSSGSSRTSYSITCSSTSSLKPPSKGSSMDLKRIRPSQRRAFLEAAATTEPPTSSRASTEEKEHVNRYHSHSQIDPEVETPMRPIDNPDALHRMLQSVSKSWSAANAGSATAGTRSEPCLGANSSKLSSRNVTPVPNNSKNLQPKASRKAPFSSLKNCAALQQIAPVGPAPLPSRSIPRHIQIAMARTEAAENPIKEAVAKLESPVRTRPRKSFVNSGNNAMPPPPPPPNPLPSKQQPHFRSAYVCDLPASNMSFESASESQIEPVCKPVEHSERPEKGDVKDAEDSYDDLSFVDVDGLMDVDLEEPSGSSPAVEQHVPCTTQESKTMSCSQPALSGQAQERSAASAVQNPTPVIKRETFSSMFSTPIQVDVFAPKALGMRRVHSGPTSGRNASNSSASASGAKSGTAPPGSHSSTRGPKPFKVPWAHNETSVATLEPSVVPEVRKPTPKRRGIMDLDTSTDSSFSFDDMDVEVVEHLLSQIGA